MFDISLILLTGVLATLLYVIAISRGNKLRSFIHKHGYEYPVTYPHLDPLFGIDLKLQKIRQSFEN